MREILFRGKRTDNGEWVYGFFCECPCDDGTDIPSIMRIESKKNYRIFMQYPIISETRGQFTGLCDKNGTRIFEGDIIVWEYDKPDIDGSVHTSPEAVIWNKNYCGFINDDMVAVDEECKVIGNIFDNPELLEENKDE